MKRILIVCTCLLMAAVGMVAQEDYKTLASKFEYQNRDFHELKPLPSSAIKFKNRPRNVILLIGDGMGVSQVFAGYTANKGRLNLQHLKHIGFSFTQSSDKYVTDSAAGGTAIASGKKTQNGVVGKDNENRQVTSVLGYAEKNGMATGLVSTSSITHATPASFIAHQPSRKLYENIAADFLLTDVDLFMGGGRDHFEHRKDGRNLISELEGKGYTMVQSLDAVTSDVSLPLGVLAAKKHLPDYTGRGDFLVESTALAVNLLSKQKGGFFLMVEGAQIDWGGHKNDAGYVVREMLDFDRAIGEALVFAANDKNTLVVVTADHETGGMNLFGGDIERGYVEAGFSTGGHTGVMVPVFAFGCGASDFIGMYENTELFYKLTKLLRLKGIE